MKKIALILIFSMIISILGMFMAGCSAESTDSQSLDPISSQEQSQNSGGAEQEHLSGFSTDTLPEPDYLEEVIKNMTLEQKISQMLMPSLRYETYVTDYNYVPVTELSDDMADLIARHGFAGIILFTENFEGKENAKQEAYDLISAIKTANAEGGNIPLLIACDQEGGYIRRIPFGTYTPGNMAIAAAGTREDTEAAAMIIGSELNALGINLDFAPVADINNNPSNPIIGVRSFSDDPDLAARMVGYFVEGLHGCRIAACLKHFPGHGNTDVDSHTGLPLVEKTYDEIASSELNPFRAGIDSGADMIMTAHIQFPMIETGTYVSKDGTDVYLPATLSKTILTGILREKLGYTGVICTDGLNMDAIKEYYRREDVAELAINAGADILLLPVDFRMDMPEYLSEMEDYISMVEELVDEGRISESRIDESVMRILKLKEKMGLLDDTADSVAYSLSDVGSKEHHDEELKIAEHAVTLIKNDDVLPIGKDESVICMTPYSSQKTALEYTQELLLEKGLISSAEDLTIVDYSDMYLDEVRSIFSDAVARVDKVIVISSLYSERGLNDSDADKVDYIISASHDAGKKVLMISSMLPYDLSRFRSADALMACYLASGMEGRPDYTGGEVTGFGANIMAAVLVAYGDSVPQGRLPVDIPSVIVGDNGYTYGTDIEYRRGTGYSY